jgi:hypothetical protein
MGCLRETNLTNAVMMLVNCFYYLLVYLVLLVIHFVASENVKHSFCLYFSLHSGFTYFIICLSVRLTYLVILVYCFKFLLCNGVKGSFFSLMVLMDFGKLGGSDITCYLSFIYF